MRPSAPVTHGLLVVDKPAGMTSHDVVGGCAGSPGTRKIGHAGTLDPMATGVLVLGVDRATRLIGHLALDTKSYTATVRLGAATSTDDAEGEIIAEADAGAVTEHAVRAGLDALTGDIEQVPSTVSAIRVDGKRAYARARAAEEVVLAARPVTVSGLALDAVRRAGPHLDLDVTVDCTSGTYVRALARDPVPAWASVATSPRCAVPGSARTTSTSPAPSTSWPTTSRCCPSPGGAGSVPEPRPRRAAGPRRARRTPPRRVPRPDDRRLRPRRRVPGALRAARGPGPRGRGVRAGSSRG